MLHAGDIKLVQSTGQPVDCGASVRARGDEFGYQRIVVNADLGAFEDAGIERVCLPRSAAYIAERDDQSRGRKLRLGSSA